MVILLSIPFRWIINVIVGWVDTNCKAYGSNWITDAPSLWLPPSVCLYLFLCLHLNHTAAAAPQDGDCRTVNEIDSLPPALSPQLSPTGSDVTTPPPGDVTPPVDDVTPAAAGDVTLGGLDPLRPAANPSRGPSNLQLLSEPPQPDLLSHLSSVSRRHGTRNGARDTGWGTGWCMARGTGWCMGRGTLRSRVGHELVKGTDDESVWAGVWSGRVVCADIPIG